MKVRTALRGERAARKAKAGKKLADEAALYKAGFQAAEREERDKALSVAAGEHVPAGKVRQQRQAQVPLRSSHCAPPPFPRNQPFWLHTVLPFSLSRSLSLSFFLSSPSPAPPSCVCSRDLWLVGVLMFGGGPLGSAVTGDESRPRQVRLRVSSLLLYYSRCKSWKALEPRVE
jgi:hypothetical protein